MFLQSLSRREVMRRCAGGCGAIALQALLADAVSADSSSAARTQSHSQQPHFPPRAKNVIFLFMSGGVSHVDSFDPKPKLTALHNESLTVNNYRGKPGEFKMFIKQPDWQFQPGGRCGTPVSDLFPHIRSMADELCVIRSLVTDHTGHFNSTLAMHTGSFNFARPSMGAWVSYGLGTENQNLPAFMVLAPHTPYAGTLNWSADFLPANHQGTLVTPGPEPIPNVARTGGSALSQTAELNLLEELNQRHLSITGADAALEGRIRAFETAFRMQTAAPEAFDLSQETESTLRSYGLESGIQTGFAWQCLMARRLVEHGVRFVELIDTGSSGNWDSHGNMQDHAGLAKNVDQPIAALLADLRQRGLLDETLVVWTTEFGRTPFNEQPGMGGREHHHLAFSSWLAGGGVKPGMIYGATDDLGLEVVEDRVHLHDFHATILHLLGLDHEQLTFRHGGRDYRLTDVHGRIVKQIIS